MADDILYDWKTRRRLDDWKLEGNGELLWGEDGSLEVRTYNLGPLRRATNIWLRDLDLPENFEVAWTFRNGSDTSNTVNGEGVMIVFNALPVALKNLWEDTRPQARYSSMWGYGKMVCYTCGFFRTAYGGASQLRKLGGNVPRTWGETVAAEDDFQKLTIVSKADEPLTAADAGKDTRYKLVRTGNRIQLWCKDVLVHDYTDTGAYPYWPDNLVGGKMAFREFNGYIVNWYSDITVRKL
ncbi:MAG: DUF1961 family protein [Planctomycetes bacterium]|nr:DUF1961 family protein [Planctomycetota bacterium]